MENESQQQPEPHLASFAGAPFYQPLSTTDPEIRLLTLVPSDDPSAMVSCTLCTVALSTKPAYIALSYAWGEASNKRNILVNGQIVSILASLAGALSAIRSWSRRVVVIWADDLCINQHDCREKSHQVKLMSRIYAGASLVLGWLGESADDTDNAIEVLYKMAEEIRKHEANDMQILTQLSFDEIVDTYDISLAVGPKRVEPTAQQGSKHVNYLESGYDSIQQPSSPVSGSRGGEVIIQSNTTKTKLAWWLEKMPELIKDGDREHPDIPNHAWTTIEALFQRPFWKRLWIRQEVVLAQHLILLCGQKLITWDVISLVSNYFRRSMTEETWNHFPPSFRFDVMAMDWGGAIDIQLWRHSLDRILREQGALMSIFVMIPMTSGLEASNPRDYIYGILGISEFGPSDWDISIDYSRPIESLYSEFSSHWIEFATACSRVDLKLKHHPLCLAGIGYLRQFTSLPSWALDLSVLRTAEMNRIGLEGYHAAGESTFHMAMANTDGAVLRLRGDVVATITDIWLFDTSHSIQDYVASVTRELLVIYDMDPRSVRAEILHIIYQTFMVNPSHMPRTRTFRPGSTTYLENFASFIWCLLIKHIEEVENRTIDEEDFKSMLHDIKCSRELRIPRSESGIIDFTLYEELLFTVTAEKEMSNFFNWMMHTAVFRCLFITKEGFIGLGPRLQMKGDVICIIPGIDVPVVLRPSRGHYQLVGPCYVHGLMNGEAVDVDVTVWLTSLQEIELQ